MQAIIDQLHLEKKHLVQLWTRFTQYDKDKSGMIEVDEFYRMIHEKRSIFGDSIFELIDIDHSGGLEFSEFVQTLGTYCIFGQQDILKFCFYIFDKDKNGFIEMDELHALIDVLHDVEKTSNLTVALNKLDRNGDGKIDFKEFIEMNKEFPQLLFPAFRIQENMMEFTLGQQFWKDARSTLEEERQKSRNLSEESRLKEEARKYRMRAAAIKKKMGFFQYYTNCSGRKKHFDAIEEEEREAREKEAQKKARLKKAKELKEQVKEAEEKKKQLEKDKNDEPEPPPSAASARAKEEEKKKRKR
jgi:Ca2+-binding EF-hand superfamily protein